ncbi:MAG: chloramphenicol phosphotransferase, partial [Thermotogota bacterium]|nr:chloramphenicol phosphotransferase [Thermotogota bacterium]
EKDRGDRSIGLARYQFDRVHRHGLYDLELDTSVMSAAECVAEIQAALDGKREPSAFERLATLR